MRIETILFRDTIRNDDCNNSFAYLATNFMSWQTKNKTKNTQLKKQQQQHKQTIKYSIQDKKI